jgi:hypothetical protein
MWKVTPLVRTVIALAASAAVLYVYWFVIRRQQSSQDTPQETAWIPRAEQPTDTTTTMNGKQVTEWGTLEPMGG